MIDSRKLDRLIVVERKSDTVDDFGTPIEGWSPVTTLRAQRLENGSREFVRSYGVAEEGSAVFRIRYVAGITTTDRVLFDGEPFDLVEIVELGRRQGLDLRVKSQREAAP